MSVAANPPAAPAAPGGRGVDYKWIALSNTTLGILMVTINQSILLISLPALFRGINLNPLVPSNTSYFLWVFMGFVLVTAVLVVSLGRVGDIYGRVRMYNLGFAVFTFFSIMLSVTFLTGPAGALWIIIMRVFQGVGGAFLFANSTAILTDAFPEDERGKAMGINGIAAVSGSFLGLLLGGVLAPIEWRLVFLVSVPFGLFGTVWAYLMLRDNGIRIPAKIDWLGNALFAIGLVSLLTGIVYSLLPYGGHPTGWTSPWVLTAVIGGIAVLALFAWVETKVPEPMFRLGLFRIRAFTAGNIAGLLGALGRGGLQFMLIIWLQGIWLPQHGYSFSETPLWAGIAMVPLTIGFLLVGPLAGVLSDRYGARLLATAGLVVSGAAFLLLELLPINFSYIWFAVLILLFAVGMGLFFSPNQASVMNSLPPDQRGAGAGMLNTFQNSATVLSMGLFFTIVTLGLASHLPKHLYSGLVAAGVSPAAAHTVASEPPIGSLFSAFLGYNPIQELLAPTGALQHLPPGQAAYITGRSFFPKLIEQPFASGLHLAFTFAAIATAIAIIASAVRGQRYTHTPEPLAEELAEGAAEAGGLLGLEPLATDGRDAPDTIGHGAGTGNGHPGPSGHAARDEGQPANGTRPVNGKRPAGEGVPPTGSRPPTRGGPPTVSGRTERCRQRLPARMRNPAHRERREAVNAMTRARSAQDTGKRADGSAAAGHSADASVGAGNAEDAAGGSAGVAGGSAGAQHAAGGGSGRLLGIGAAAQRLGVSERALRYYQQIGLIVPASTTPGGLRRYSESDVARVERIMELKTLLGLNLDEVALVLRNEDRIAQIRQTYKDERTSDEERRQLTRECLTLQEDLRATVEAKRAALEAFLADLDARITRARALLAGQRTPQR